MPTGEGASPQGTAVEGESPASQSSAIQSSSTWRDALLAEDAAFGKQARDLGAIWLDTFRKIKKDNEVVREDLPRALEMAGFAKPKQEWVDEIFGKITTYSGLEVEEFVNFLRAYSAHEQRACAEAFARCENNSGTIEKKEIAPLLRSLNVEPMQHVLNEAFREVKDKDSDFCDLQEFQHLMDLILKREGFTRREYEDFMRIYRRCDRDGNGGVDTKELIGILGWLGYAVEQEQAMKFMSEVDIDGGGTMNEREFLMCMRKVREREMKRIYEIMCESDDDEDGKISGTELEKVLAGLGHQMPDRDAIQEAARDAGLHAMSMQLDLSGLWQFLTVYRQREGFNTAEAMEIKEAFERYDKDRVGEISSLEVGKLLRWLGYTLPYEVLQHFINRVDIDDSGALDLPELRKLIRMHREREQTLMQEAFRQQEAVEDGTISKEQAHAALIGLGHSDNRDEHVEEDEDEASDDLFLVSEALATVGNRVDLKTFMRIAVRASKAARKAFRKNGGFSTSQVAMMKHVFRRYDLDGSGDIDNKELIFLIEDILPEMAHDTNMRPELVRLMREADADGNGSLDFPDFLRLMRQFHELQDRERVAKEQTAIKETGFTQTEVAGFRELFIAAAGDDGSGQVSFEEVCNLIHTVTPLGDKYLHQLHAIFREVTGGCRDGKRTQQKVRQYVRRQGLLQNLRERVEAGGQKCDTPAVTKVKQESADFPEFLWLMKRLLDSDFASIRERTTNTVERSARGVAEAGQ